MMTTSDPAFTPAAKHLFYYSPGTCSLAPHIVLEEIGEPYELELISASGPREGEMTSKPEGDQSEGTRAGLAGHSRPHRGRR